MWERYYRNNMADKTGQKLMAVLVRRFDYQGQYRAFSDVYADNESLMKRLFEMEDNNEIVKTSMTLARIHTTQT